MQPFGTLKSGEIITAESEIVKKMLEENPDFSVEYAIASVLLKDEQYNTIEE